MAALLADRERLADWPLEPGLDPLAADFDRSLGELALLRGEAAGAVTSLTQLAAAEAAAGLPSPAHGWTLVLLGRAADRLGDTGGQPSPSARSPSWPVPGSTPAIR